jgi:hypothetical protein
MTEGPRRSRPSPSRCRRWSSCRRTCSSAPCVRASLTWGPRGPQGQGGQNGGENDGENDGENEGQNVGNLGWGPPKTPLTPPPPPGPRSPRPRHLHRGPDRRRALAPAPRQDPLARLGGLRGLGLHIDEGALVLSTATRCTYRDFPYKREWGGKNDRRPSSKPASASAVCRAAVCMCRCTCASSFAAFASLWGDKGVNFSLVHPLFHTKIDWHQR